jgi:hypothetical protein
MVPWVTKTSGTYEIIYLKVVLFDGSVLPVSGNHDCNIPVGYGNDLNYTFLSFSSYCK